MTENGAAASDQQKPCCGNCNAWKRTRENSGECLANPPVPMVVGMQEVPVSGNNIMMPGRGQQVTVVPNIHSFFPGMKAHGWCRGWQPNQEWLAEQMRLNMEEPMKTQGAIGQIIGGVQ